LMQALASPGIGIRQLDLRMQGAAGRRVRNVLPDDRGLQEAQGDRGEPARGGKPRFFGFRIILWQKEGTTHYRTRGAIEEIRGELGGVVEDERRLRAAVEKAVFKAARSGGRAIATLSTPPPWGAGVPYAALFRVAELVDQAGIGRVLFEGSTW